MKSIKLTLALVLAGGLVFGQGSDRTNAIMAFKDFTKAAQDQNFDKAEKSIKEAKEYIDKAYAAAPTDHKTLFYKGSIYQSMALTLIDPASFTTMQKDPCSGEPKLKAGIDEKKAKADMEMYATESAKAFKEAMANPNKKDDFSDQIKFAVNMQSITVFNCGSKFFNDKKYKEAAESFQQSIMAKDIIGIADTLGYYNSALCYERLKDYNNAAKMWAKCAELKYNGADAYAGMANAYRNAGKEEESAKALKAGRAAFPKDQGLIISEVNYFLGKGDNAAAEKSINEAIALDSKNATLYFALGSVYDNLANPKGYVDIGMDRAEVEKLTGAATRSEKVTLEGKEYENAFYGTKRITYDNGKVKAITGDKVIDLKKPANYTELIQKGENAYKKSIEIDGNYFDALFNLGAMKYNEGAEIMNKIKDISDDALYNAEKGKADEKFKAALPYNEKAREVNPKDRDNLMMLKNIYARLGNTEKASEINNLLKN